MNTGDQARSAKWAAFQLVKVAGLTLAVAFIFVASYLGLGVWMQLQSVPDIASLQSYDQGDAVQIFDRNDRLVFSFKGEENRRRVALNQISPYLKAAVLAAEDHNFYQHQGVSPSSVLRALLSNLQARRIVEGGSTITQQLVKNLFFEQPKRTLERKVAEALIACDLERQYSKDQILEMYLNEAYFGNGAYGAEQAAHYYFGKPAAKLSIGESAFLAGLIKSPSRLGNPANRNLAIEQQLETVDRMLKYGLTTRLAANFARQQELVFWKHSEKANAQPITKYPYFVSYVMDLVQQRFNPGEIRRHGLKVFTSLDSEAQEIAETTLRRGIDSAPAGVTQGALVTVSVKDGSVIALVGGTGDFQTSQFNRATHPHTAGSSFKPFVYLTALEQGVLTPESFIEDSPLTVKEPGRATWAPKNFDSKFLGQITVRDALVYSRNVCAVRVTQMVGIANVIATAQRAGITDPLDANPSLALGSSAVSPLEMAGAYATFARSGLFIRPWVLGRIEDKRGHVIRAYDQPVSRAFGPQPTAELTDMLREVVTRGTGEGAHIRNLFVAGKTGTSDQAKDLWFIGFTPDLVTAVWGGNDDNKPIAGAHVTGGTVMASIWRDYTKAIYGNRSLARSGLIRLAKTVDKRDTPQPVLRTPPAASADELSPSTEHEDRIPQKTARRQPPAPSRVLLKPQQARLDTSANPPPQSAKMGYGTPAAARRDYAPTPAQDSIRYKF